MGETGEGVAVILVLLKILSHVQILAQEVTEVAHREGVHPVVVRRIPVASLNHQAKPMGEEHNIAFTY